MKKNCSAEIKIIVAATALLLAFFSIVVGNSVFKDKDEELKFVYNLSCDECGVSVNNSDIL